MKWLKRNWKKILIGFVILIAVAAAYIFYSVHENLSSLKDRAVNYHVKILRDSYVLMVIWDKDGNVHSMSVPQYGSATLHPESPHYADQSPLLANRQLKPVWFNETDIRQHIEREYVPGNE